MNHTVIFFLLLVYHIAAWRYFDARTLWRLYTLRHPQGLVPTLIVWAGTAALIVFFVAAYSELLLYFLGPDGVFTHFQNKQL